MGPRRAPVILFSVSLWTGALLLFAVQPLVGRALLPTYGGSSAVWNSCLVFFQLALLLGYAWPLLLEKLTHDLRLQVGAQALLWVVAALLSLPLHLSPAPPQVEGALPSLWWALISGVASPVVALGTCAPLLQRWFSRTGHEHAADPYFLYGASNLGSLLALLGYPLLLEPLVSGASLSQAWSVGFVLQGALVLACGLYAWRGAAAPSPEAPPQATQAPAAPDAGWKTPGRWLLLSALPSALLVSVTEHLTTDLSALPLLWTVPLALYLLTFVLAFSRRAWEPWPWLRQSLGIWVLVLVAAQGLGATEPAWLLLPLHLLTAASLWWVLHRALAGSRPGPERLTGFYLWLSLGGALGGATAALLAPALLPDTWEHALLMILALALLPTSRAVPGGWRARLPDAALLPLVGALTAASLLWLGPGLGAADSPRAALWLLALPALALYGFASRPRALAAGLLGMFAALLAFHQPPLGQVLWSRRNFYGVIKVAQRGDTRVMIHGNTLHGGAATQGDACQLSTYYHPSGPLGQALGRWRRPEQAQVGVIGLGVGTMACYGHQGEAWTFYEINPAVIEAATDPKLLRVLDSAPVQPQLHQGDARALLRQEQTRYHLFVVDAFSSDAIPVHLLTREAVQLYRDHLRQDGWLLFNISNRLIDLRPVLAAHARALGMVAWQWEDKDISPEQRSAGKAASRWVAMAPLGRSMASALGPGWSPLQPTGHEPQWTDDSSSLLSLLLAR